MRKQACKAEALQFWDCPPVYPHLTVCECVFVREESVGISVPESACAANGPGTGLAVVGPGGVELGQLRAGRGYNIHLWSRFLIPVHLQSSVKILFCSFYKLSTRWSDSFRSRSVEL